MPTIDIRTTQNVTIEYELASLWERLVALIIDVVIVGTLNFFVASLVDSALGRAGIMGVVYTLLPICLFMGYQLLSEVLADGRSWGKKIMSLKVVRLDGEEPGLSDYLLRAIFHLVDTVLSIGILGALIISSTRQRQRLGDMTANTTVIRTKHQVQFALEDILRINTLSNYEPQYPEVRQFNEQDMLLIKGVIARCSKYKNQAHQQALGELVDTVCLKLGITDVPNDKIKFLKTLIRDYIVLTR